MKTCLAALLALAATGIAAQAQLKLNSWDYQNYPGPFSGGTSTGATLVVSGTANQTYEAAVMRGGTMVAGGGFWLPEGLTMPRLRVQRAGTNIVVAWPDPSTRYRLFRSPVVVPVGWTSVTNRPAIVGNEKQVTLPRSDSKAFLELYKPW